MPLKKLVGGFILTLLLMGFAFTSATWARSYAILHSFKGGDGANPNDSLVTDGTALYGMTWGGGSGYLGLGVIFKMNINGTGFTILHPFNGYIVNTDGMNPPGSLTLSGRALYGMAYAINSLTGVLFKINTDGSDYSVLHLFGSDTFTSGTAPGKGLTLSGTSLYGITQYGGVESCVGGGGYARGTVFEMNTDGSNFNLLHSFSECAGINLCGWVPFGSLIVSDSTLYGTTTDKPFTQGALFKLNTDGTQYTILHRFYPWGDGYSPYGSLTLSGSTLYGMTAWGGWAGGGVIFKINTDGTNYTILHSFGDGTVANDGWTPYGSLTQSGSVLYGMTSGGGAGGYGVIFRMSMDGEDYAILHSFGDGTIANDGKDPHGSLLLSGSTFYGMTRSGGSNDMGTIFSLPLQGPGMPTGVSAIAGKAQATVSFRAPASTVGSKITSYTVTSNPAGGVDVNAGSSSLTHIVTGLKNGTNYTFTVTATNADGLSATSSASNHITTWNVPGKPTITSLKAGNSQVTIGFSPPASNGGTPIMGYTVTSNPADGKDTNTGSPSHRHVVDNLKNGALYEFTVTATNPVGSNTSLPSRAITPATVPDPPTNVQAMQGTSKGSVIVTFTPTPTVSDGGRKITGYTVTSPSDIKIKVSATSSPIELTGLKSGKSYVFNVVANNAMGSSIPVSCGPITTK